MSAIVVVHEVGDRAGGAPWREAFGTAAFAPDLPGHGSAAPPLSGHYELNDVILAAAEWLIEQPAEVLVGVGSSGWAAQMLAVGGRARSLVLVDGLGGPWTDAKGAIADGVRWARAISDDPAALAPAPVGGDDPRLRHGVPAMCSRGLAERAAAAVAVPVLLIETPSSALDGDEVEELAGRFPCGAEIVRTSSRAEAAEVVLAWR